MENKKMKCFIPVAILIISMFYFCIMFFYVGLVLEPLGEKSKQRFISFIWGFVFLFIVLSLLLGLYKNLNTKGKWFDTISLVFFFILLGYLIFEMFIPHSKSFMPDDKSAMFLLGVAFSGVYFYLICGCLNLMGIGNKKNKR